MTEFAIKENSRKKEGGVPTKLRISQLLIVLVYQTMYKINSHCRGGGAVHLAKAGKGNAVNQRCRAL